MQIKKEFAMNSQIFPGLSESFIRQEHERMLKEAKMSRLLQETKDSPPIPHHQFPILWMIKRVKPVREPKPAYTHPF